MFWRVLRKIGGDGDQTLFQTRRKGESRGTRRPERNHQKGAPPKGRGITQKSHGRDIEKSRAGVKKGKKREKTVKQGREKP